MTLLGCDMVQKWMFALQIADFHCYSFIRRKLKFELIKLGFGPSGVVVIRKAIVHFFIGVFIIKERYAIGPRFQTIDCISDHFIAESIFGNVKFFIWVFSGKRFIRSINLKLNSSFRISDIRNFNRDVMLALSRWVHHKGTRKNWNQQKEKPSAKFHTLMYIF